MPIPNGTYLSSKYFFSRLDNFVCVPYERSSIENHHYHTDVRQLLSLNRFKSFNLVVIISICFCSFLFSKAQNNIPYCFAVYEEKHCWSKCPHHKKKQETKRRFWYRWPNVEHQLLQRKMTPKDTWKRWHHLLKASCILKRATRALCSRVGSWQTKISTSQANTGKTTTVLTQW